MDDNHSRDSIESDKSEQENTITPKEQPTLPEDKASVNSILHLLGDWIFCAALAGFDKKLDEDLNSNFDEETFRTAQEGTPSNFDAQTFISRATGRTGNTHHTHLTEVNTVLDSATQYNHISGLDQELASMASGTRTILSHTTGIDKKSVIPGIPAVLGYYNSCIHGRAEAIALLCRIFSQKAIKETVEEVYLVRFYNVISKALKIKNERLISAIILNSETIFRVNLPGVEMLIPAIMGALDRILPDGELVEFRQHCNITMLRRSAANILLSVISYIITLPELTIMVIPGGSNLVDPEESYDDDIEKLGDMRPRAVHLLNGALETEKDDENIQIILSGLYYTLQECSSREKDALTNPNAPKPIYSTIAGNNLGKNITRSFQLHSAYGLYVQCLSTLNDRLSVQWKNSLPVTLAVFELLSAMSKLRADAMKNWDR